MHHFPLSRIYNPSLSSLSSFTQTKKSPGSSPVCATFLLKHANCCCRGFFCFPPILARGHSKCGNEIIADHCWLKRNAWCLIFVSPVGLCGWFTKKCDGPSTSKATGCLTVPSFFSPSLPSGTGSGCKAISTVTTPSSHSLVKKAPLERRVVSTSV